MEGRSSCHHQEYKIAGYTVLFPCKPYPSQFSMIDKIIRGIERHHNCLLESPTGSGKSLALLCSTLAWQTAEKRKVEIENQSTCGKTCQCQCHAAKPEASPRQSASTTITSSAVAAAAAAAAAATDFAEAAAPVGAVSGASCVAVSGDSGTGKPALGHTPGGGDVSVVIDGDSDEDFRPLKKFRGDLDKSSTGTRKKKARVSIEYEDTPPSSPAPTIPNPTTTATGHDAGQPAHAAHEGITASASDVSRNGGPLSSATTTTTTTPCSQCCCAAVPQKGASRKVPKIYFGTRTHKQVAQIVRELRKTAYHDVLMTILGSREHTCIHPQVSKSANKNEGCEQLMKDDGCRFKDRVMKYQTQAAIRSIGLHTAWDLEDLIDVLKKKKACPYFVSRGIKEQSDLIICPYNYLVDPLIRDSMEINLKGQIVLLDEAHNIEDFVREAASQTLSQEQIRKALTDMDGLIEKGQKIADISKLRQMCHRLDTFIEDMSSTLTQHDFEQSYRMWSGFDIIAQLRSLGLGPQDCDLYTAAVASVKAAEQEERQYTTGADIPTLSSATWTLLEQMFLVLKYLYKDSMKHAEDYRMSIVKSIQYVSANLNGSWLNSRKNYGRKTPVEVFTLNFWCMNPAVGFAELECCRSVILTSGTLSPMNSFQSELGQPFPIALEANHIIKDSQVWVGAVGQGPDGTSLQAVYRNMESFVFQDSLGQLILSVCKKVPKGILCFLPSYKVLERLTNRWKATGLWARMEEHKHLMCEPRRSDKMDFEQIICGFYSIIHRAEECGDDGGVDGALFFAVCRGKVSEGLDFADNFARAVITVGIPYPNFKDLQVELKRKYNDKYHSSRGLLSGSQWYEIQAFRALNQALGRCIRHRKDWGALIIVDDRFVKNTLKYASGLSKWVRQKLHVHQSCSDMLTSLSDFTRSRLEAQQQEDSLNDSQLPPTPQTPSSQTALPPPQPQPPAPMTPLPPTLSTTTTPPLDSRTPLHDVSNTADSSTSPSLFSPTPSTSHVQLPPPLPQLDSVTGSNVVQNKGDRSAWPSSADTEKRAPVAGVSAASTSRAEVVARRKESARSAVQPSSSCQRGGVVKAAKSQSLQNVRTDDGAVELSGQVQSPAPSASQTCSLSVPCTGAIVSQVQAGVTVSQVRTGTTVSQVRTGTAVSRGQRGGKRRVVHPGQAAKATPKIVSLLSGKAVPAGAATLHPQTVPGAAGAPGTVPTTDHPVSAAGKGVPLTQSQAPAELSDADTLMCLPSGKVVPLKKVTLVLVKDPSFVPMSITLSSTQSPGNMPLPPVLASRVGQEVVTVPAGIEHVVFSSTQNTSQVQVPESQLHPQLPPLPTVNEGTGSSASSGSVRGKVLQKSSDRTSAAEAMTVLKKINLNESSVNQSLITAALKGNGNRGNSPARVVGHFSSQTSGRSSTAKAMTVLKKINLNESCVNQSLITAALKGNGNRGNSPAQVVGHFSSQTSGRSSLLSGSTSPAARQMISIGGSLKSASPASSQTVRDKTDSGSLTPDVQKMRSLLAGRGCTTTAQNRTSGRSATKVGDGSTSSLVLPSVTEPTLSEANDAASGGKTLAQADGEVSVSGTSTSARGYKALTKKCLFRKASRKGADRNVPDQTSANRGVPDETSANGNIPDETIGSRNVPDQTSANTPHRQMSAAGLSGTDNKGDRNASSTTKSETGNVSETAEGEGEAVARRVRGAKRRSLRLCGDTKKRRPSDVLDNIAEETRSSMQCAACGFVLLDSVRDLDFERRDTMPSYLKGMVDITQPEVLYFKGATITQKLKLPSSPQGSSRRQQIGSNMEATVELIHCPGCAPIPHHHHQHHHPHSAATTLLGAKVTLIDPVNSASTGQMWIFAHKVTMSFNNKTQDC
ncbi:uncharacterized protein LOC143302332 [Babylonia areolata]|uniref:uncharacterized protein LOC143302332 n=1 Tax=Babylonia areolata TaxID=304850 RepID=UPI003FD1C25E